jgi:SAM-dependent methyltransferase
MRTFSEKRFEEAFDTMVSDVVWQEEPHYYPRYRSRYQAMIRQFADSAPDRSLDILEVGGGQLAYLTMKLWGQDGAFVADIGETCFKDLNNQGIKTFVWNLALADPPIDQKFDIIFFSEVIEHLPIPGYIPLARLRSILRPGGLLLCSTPNLYRLRNIFFLASGRQIFDHFALPGAQGYGHVLEYSLEHLAWQFEQAGFDDFDIQLREFAHTPSRPLDRLLALAGSPVRSIPRFKDNLLAVARA